MTIIVKKNLKIRNENLNQSVTIYKSFAIEQARWAVCTRYDLVSGLVNKHKTYLNSRATYPWRKFPEITCQIWKAKYKYSIKRKLKIRKRDFTLIFLVLAQLIVFIMDLCYNMPQSEKKHMLSENSTNTDMSQSMCSNNNYFGTHQDEVASDNIQGWDNLFHNFLAKVVYKGANLLTVITVLSLITAGIYNVYQGLKKSIIVHPIKKLPIKPR